MNPGNIKAVYRSRASLEEAWRAIEQHARTCEPESVPFTLAGGRVLAEDVACQQDVPSLNVAAVEGYAIRSKDAPGTVSLFDPGLAEVGAPGSLRRRAVAVRCGDRIPSNADAVVEAGQATRNDDRIVLGHAVQPGDNIERPGDDARSGRVVLERGRRLRPVDLALLAATGALEVCVRRRPAVHVVPLGADLVPAGARPRDGEVVDATGRLLSALIDREGGRAVLHAIALDERLALETLLRDLVESANPDLVLFTGRAATRGRVLPALVRELGEPVFGEVAVTPASETLFALVSGVPVLLVPWLPMEAHVSFDLFARPLLQRMVAVRPHLPYPVVQARLSRAVRRGAQAEVLQVTLARTSDGVPLASILSESAARWSTLTAADGFLLLQGGEPMLPAGALVTVHAYELQGEG